MDNALNSDLAVLLFVGKVSRSFEVLGQRIELQSLDSDTLSDLAAQCSGLDVLARERRYSILSVTHSLTQVGGYTFKTFEERRQFVGKLQQPVLDLFIGHYLTLREDQKRLVEEKLADIKKSQPIQSPVASGVSSSNSQDT